MYERILNHIIKYGSITSLEAIKEYGCTRLSHYIYLLRHNGYNVESERIKHVNKYGDRCTYCRYYISDEEVKEDGTKKNVIN